VSEQPSGLEPVRRARLWEAFRYRDYTLLWTAAATANVVMWMRILGTAQWLFDETGSAAQLGLIGVVQLVVQIPALLYGGTLADHVNRKRLMAISNGAPLLVMFALGVLDASGTLNVWLVYVGIAVMSMTQMIGRPAQNAMVPAVVPERQLMRAVATDAAGQNMSAIVGPLLFATIASVFDLTAVFFVAAAIAIPSAVLPLAIRAAGRAEGASDGSTAQRTWEGFLFTVRHPILPGLFLLDTGITVVSFYREILPALARGLFRGGAGATGVLGAANSVGAIAGSFLTLTLDGYRAKGMLVLYASLAYAVIFLGFGLVTTLWAGVLMIALLGGADAVTVAVRRTTVQLTTPDHMRGRAFSFMLLSAQTANNLGTIWIGFWAAAIGAPNTVVLGALLALLATLVIWRVWRPIREYRD
jgi:sugar phosphate permease